jgi:hypothetical protein
MPTGNLVVQLSDMIGRAVAPVDVDLNRLKGLPGTGGETMDVSLASPVEELTITGVSCRSGPGTMYRILATTPHFRPYGFFQLIRENQNNTAADDVEFWVKPGDVSDITAPTFADLPARARTILEDAEMIVVKPEDEDLAELAGEELYRGFGPMRKACFLNLVAKASHAATTGDCLSLIDSLMVCRQDRFFARVDSGLPKQLQKSPLFKSASALLHDAPDGFEKTDMSFKSRDAHANLQVTFMREIASGALAADIDIDESSGIEHGFEVIRNATLNKRTNPYLVREFLLAADPIKRSLDPGYRFRF